MKPTVRMAALGDYPLIIPSRPHSIRTLVEAECGRRGVTLNIALEVDAISSVLDLVERGLGHAILSRTAVVGWAKHGRVQARRIVEPAVEGADDGTRRVRRHHEAGIPEVVVDQVEALGTREHAQPRPELLGKRRRVEEAQRGALAVAVAAREPGATGEIDHETGWRRRRRLERQAAAPDPELAGDPVELPRRQVAGIELVQQQREHVFLLDRPPVAAGRVPPGAQRHAVTGKHARTLVGLLRRATTPTRCGLAEVDRSNAG